MEAINILIRQEVENNAQQTIQLKEHDERIKRLEQSDVKAVLRTDLHYSGCTTNNTNPTCIKKFLAQATISYVINANGGDMSASFTGLIKSGVNGLSDIVNDVQIVDKGFAVSLKISDRELQVVGTDKKIEWTGLFTIVG